MGRSPRCFAYLTIIFTIQVNSEEVTRVYRKRQILH